MAAWSPLPLTALFIVAVAVSTSAQPGARSADVLATVPNVAQFADAGAATELRVRWIVADSPSDEPIAAGDVQAVNRFEVIAQRRTPAAFVRERAPQLSTESLVVIATDAGGRDVAWQQVRDPRIVRAEIPDANLELSGQMLYRPVTELLLAFPDGLSIAAIHVFAVERTAGGFTLREIGEFPLAAR